MRNALVVALAILCTTPVAGCRAICCGSKQDVILTVPRGETVYVDGTQVAPGSIRLKRSHDHVISTDWGWSQNIESSFAWEVVLWGILLTGPFELIDFVDGSAFYLDPDFMKVPVQAPDQIQPSDKHPTRVQSTPEG